MNEVTAIVLSGGTGSRFHGSFIPKQFAEIEGKPILAYCLDTYEALPMIDEIALVINDRYEQLYYDICATGSSSTSRTDRTCATVTLPKHSATRCSVEHMSSREQPARRGRPTTRSWCSRVVDR